MKKKEKPPPLFFSPLSRCEKTASPSPRRRRAMRRRPQHPLRGFKRRKPLPYAIRLQTAMASFRIVRDVGFSSPPGLWRKPVPLPPSPPPFLRRIKQPRPLFDLAIGRRKASHFPSPPSTFFIRTRNSTSPPPPLFSLPPRGRRRRDKAFLPRPAKPRTYAHFSSFPYGP